MLSLIKPLAYICIGLL